MSPTSGRAVGLRSVLLLFVPAIAALTTIAFAQTHEATGTHPDPAAPVVLALAIILAGAKLGGHLAVRMGQPAVLGELVAGVVLGSADLVGIGRFQAIEGDPTVDILARLGVLILLFEVGLESTVRDMLKVGLPSFLVAILGVAAPFALGWGVSALLLPDRSVYVHARRLPRRASALPRECSKTSGVHSHPRRG